MSDRPSAPPHACPFVAFEDDRDRRAEVPDPRHRCYAEPTPQPRAIAHQQAYCISPDFPGCPIFLDWAARAAADPVRMAATMAIPVVSEATAAGITASDPSYAPRPTTDGGNGPAGGAVRPQVPDPAGREWAAPPPWVGEPGLRTTNPSVQSTPRVTGGGAAQLGAFPEPVKQDVDLEIGGSEAIAGAATAGAATASRGAAPASSPHAPPAAPYAPPSAGSPSSPYAPPQPYAPPPSPDALSPAPSPAPEAYGSSGPPSPIAQPAFVDIDALARQPAPVEQPRLTGRPIDGGPPPRIDLQARPAGIKQSGDDWSKPRRRGAYRLGGGRPRIGRFPMLIVVAAAVLAGALILFLLPGLLAGGAGGSPKPTGPVATATRQPTPQPTPTPRSYTVKGGDTMAAIAKDFGLTVEQVACYNQIKDPNRISAGQVLLIPPDDYECPPKGGGGGRTPKPSGSSG